ncbi:hypothetical protein GOQ30_04060 [Flavobacterium sp. TP390]|uniref:Uncharacterized protein n=1 Tax=Flavobacterium profundi TaxID=1774945 RepID=A0A6I4IFG1_9FLAO|nr:hypothetical protein [Flavobacterium profundi]MVO08338.1 hypothetical protein [Flavobacterium profundi]
MLYQYNMAHTINGIITSFKYDGKLPHVNLVGNYYLITFVPKYSSSYSEKKIEPFQELTSEIKQVIKELSFKGKCIYIETDYFGGPGYQMAIIWENGKAISDPFISYDKIENPKIPEKAKLVINAINIGLHSIGIYTHENKDEFDTVRLGDYRSYEDVLEEFLKTK